MSKRLFIAVDVDDRTRAAIDHLSEMLRRDAAVQELGKATWVQKDRLHLTLFFFGEANEAQEAMPVGALAKPLTTPAFDLTFRGFGFFPGKGPPRVLWLGIADGLEPLRAVHAEIGARMGTPPESREAFTPHLTLARFRDRVRGGARGRIAQIGTVPASAGPCRIDRVTLYESRLSPKGPTYTAAATAFLKT